MTKRLEKTDAILLRRVAYRDSDLILTFFTRSRGKISALARSARRSRRRFGGALGLFTVSEIELRAGARSDLGTLLSAQPRESYGDLAADVACFAHASYGTELVRELTAPEQQDEEAFDLLVELYRTLEDRGARAGALRSFELRLLGVLGLAPVLGGCAACGASDPDALARGVLFDPGRGGVVCPRCAPGSRGLGVRPLGESARRVLAAAQAAPSLAGAAEAEEGAAEARDAMLALLHHHVGHELRTLEFIGKIGRSVYPEGNGQDANRE